MNARGPQFRLIAAGILIATVPLVIAALVTWHHMQQIKKRISSSVLSLNSDVYTRIAQSMYNETLVAQHLLEEDLRKVLEMIDEDLRRRGPLRFSPQERITWKLPDSKNGPAKIISLPKVYLQETWLGQIEEPAVYVPVVDDVHRISGDIATIFQRINERGDMVRVASSIIGPDGKRIVGTQLSATYADGTPNPVIAHILKGEVYVGRAAIAGQWYWSAFKPVRDEHGKVMGAVAVGVAEKNVSKHLLELMLALKVGNEGYIFVINTKGDARGRYVLSKNGQRDGEIVYDSQDSSGRYFVHSMIERAHALKAGEVAVESYTWKNPGDSEPRQKLAHFVYFEPWDWLIGVSIYEDEYMEMVYQTQNLIQSSLHFQILLIAITLLLSTGCFYFIFSRIYKEQTQMQLLLSQAQKLESVGQLAAGVAHEINTPMQYISDNTHFLQETLTELQPVLESHRQLLAACKHHALTDEMVQSAETIAKKAELDYLLKESPQAVRQTMEGIGRVIKLVQAMKDFSHPGSEKKTPTDLNHAIETTVIVARGEWKYVAEVVTDLDDSLPLVPCLPSEFNQVILNILINATHAITDVVGKNKEKRGTITIQTRKLESQAEIRIRDTGPGIPEAIRSKIFDPFFTTKPVGKGSGQGLAIARSVVVHKLQGTLTFETTLGAGTTFIIRLPI